MTKPELLCPAGNMGSLRAAVAGGADAVYLGTTAFNARMRARNFGPEEVREAVALCHEKGVKVYVTLNTLLTDRQLPSALAVAADLYRAGADALIVADLGLARILHETLPDFPLHASTQATGHSARAAAFFQKIGFCRMVCARELDRNDLKTLCRTSPLPVEMFVHGAMCASCSGQCLMSSMIGGRSGNRGECAQPCRLPYDGGYPLSLKDMCLAGHMKEILSLGVASLKIEGRMKSAAYVYTVASVYRRLIDEERDARPDEIRRMGEAFSRSGFTDGYFTGRADGSMLGVRREEDAEKSAALSRAFPDRAPRRAPVVQDRPAVPEPVMPPLPAKTALTPRITYRFLKARQIPDSLPLEDCVLPLFAHVPGVGGAVMPAVVFPSEEEAVRQRLKQTYADGARDLYLAGPGQDVLAEGVGFTLHGDWRLNLTNSFAALAYEGVEDFLVSPELNLPQIRDLALPKAALIYGRLPLMHLQKSVGRAFLKDRRGASFPVVREGKRDLVLNACPLYMLDKKKDLKAAGLARRQLFFTTEEPREIRSVLSALETGEPPRTAVRRIK